MCPLGFHEMYSEHPKCALSSQNIVSNLAGAVCVHRHHGVVQLSLRHSLACRRGQKLHLSKISSKIAKFHLQNLRKSSTISVKISPRSGPACPSRPRPSDRASHYRNQSDELREMIIVVPESAKQLAHNVLNVASISSIRTSTTAFSTATIDFHDWRTWRPYLIEQPPYGFHIHRLRRAAIRKLSRLAAGQRGLATPSAPLVVLLKHARAV